MGQCWERKNHNTGIDLHSYSATRKVNTENDGTIHGLHGRTQDEPNTRNTGS